MSPPEGLEEFARRDALFLVLKDGTTAPPRCVLCNRPAGREVKMRFDDRRTPGPIGAAVAGMMNAARGRNYTGPVAARIRLCNRHHARRRWALWASLLVLAAGGVLLLYSNTHHNGRNDPFIFLPVAVLILGAVGVVGVLTGMFNVWGLTAKHFDDELVWVDGASAKFLGSLPALDENPTEEVRGTKIRLCPLFPEAWSDAAETNSSHHRVRDGTPHRSQRATTDRRPAALVGAAGVGGAFAVLLGA